MLFEVRFHGRGGQGAVTAATLLVKAAWYDGLWGQAFPFFGAERRGAPVTAYARISGRKVRLRCGIRAPDAVVVLDKSVMELVDVTAGLKPGGWLIVNTEANPSELSAEYKGFKLATVDATGIALSLGLVTAGWPVVNTAMLGALAKATGLITLNSLVKACHATWEGRVAQLNAEAVSKAYEATRVGVT